MKKNSSTPQNTAKFVFNEIVHILTTKYTFFVLIEIIKLLLSIHSYTFYKKFHQK